jgi:Flp pilus assembly protein TadD
VPYDAFISYSHADDAGIAKALQDNLHRLAKRWDSLSAIRVFRDATHLPITSLQPAIAAALDSSKFLILLASPRSAASPWVREEVAHFLKSHPPENVLFLLVAGDLVWDKSLQSFAPGPTSAFPEVDNLRLSAEPLFLDLRWTADRHDLSLSNPQFLDAVATVAATLQSVPKDILVGDLAEEHRRLRRNQRVNLGFRGAFGFGIAAALLLLLGGAYSVTSDGLLTAASAGYLYLTIGFAAVGSIGSLCCGTGWRGVMGFTVGFLVLMPLYLISSSSPSDASLGDYCVLALMLLAGFVLAGALGASACVRIRWSDGAKAFGFGGAACAVAWVVFSEFRPEGIHTHLLAWPWLPARFWLQGQRAMSVVANMFDERDTGILIPLIVGASVGGLLFGIRLADTRTMTGTEEMKAGRISKLLKSGPVGPVLATAVVLALIVWTFTLLDVSQLAKASDALNPDAFRPWLLSDDNSSNVVYGDTLPIALRARRALEQRGEQAAAREMSDFIGQALQAYAETPSRYYERYRNPGYRPPEISQIARDLKEFGRSKELAGFLQTIRDHLSKADNLEIIAAVRAEAAYGSREHAESILRSATLRVGQQDWFTRSLLAHAYFELGDVDTAKSLFRKLGADISGSAPHIGLNDQLAPESGDALWSTGVWNELPAWRDELGELLATAIEGMCRRGEREPALMLMRANKQNTGLWHAHARFAKAAADAQHYDLAFAVLDALDSPGPGWTTFDDRAAALAEIITAAVARRDTSVITKAVGQLRTVERVVRERRELDRFAGVTLANAYALAGEYDAALSVAKDIVDDRWSADSAIATAMAEAGKWREAAPLLARAWRTLQAQLTRGSSLEGAELTRIGTALASIGDFDAARAVADDMGPGSLGSLSIYTTMLEYVPSR